LSLLVFEDGNAAVLILERGLDALELFRLTLQGVDDETAAGGAHDSHGVIDVGGVHAFADVYRHDRVRRPETERQRQSGEIITCMLIFMQSHLRG